MTSQSKLYEYMYLDTSSNVYRIANMPYIEAETIRDAVMEAEQRGHDMLRDFDNLSFRVVLREVGTIYEL